MLDYMYRIIPEFNVEGIVTFFRTIFLALHVFDFLTILSTHFCFISIHYKLISIDHFFKCFYYCVKRLCNNSLILANLKVNRVYTILCICGINYRYKC